MGTGKTEYNDIDYSEILDCLNKAKSYANAAYGHMSSYYSKAPTPDEIRSAIRREATVYDSKTNELLSDMTDDNIAALERQYYYGYSNAYNELSGLPSKATQIKDNIGVVAGSVTSINDAVTEFDEDPTFNPPDSGTTEPQTTLTDPEVPVNPDFGEGDSTEDGGGDGEANLNIDLDGDGKPDLNIDLDGDGIADLNIDLDGDGKPDLNIDLDGDGKADLNVDLNGDGKPDLNIDTNGDGKADLNIDKNGDGKPDLNVDTNGDGKADLNIDKNGDGKPDLNVDTNGDGKADVNIDKNGDGKPDLNIDKNGDGKADLNIDTNGDGKPDLNIDKNGDGKADLNIDTNGDGKPDLNIDTNGNGKPDLNIDKNGDGKPDLNVDTNGDGKADVNIDNNGDGKPDLNIDTNGDGKPDVNVDRDGDGKADVNIDTNGDGKPDVNIDSNGDGYADVNIDINDDGKPDINVDTDGDGKPDKNIIPGYEQDKGDDNDGTYLDDLLKHMKFTVDDEGNIMYYDENGNAVYPFLENGIFADPEKARKFKMSENAFLEMLGGPEKGDAVDSLDLDLDKNVSSAGLAVGGMVAVGAAAANAAATMKRTKDEINDGLRTYDYDYDDDAKLTPEQYKKRKTGTIISIVLLTLLILCNEIALIASITTDVTIVLLGLAIAITAIITSMGLKIGKFYTLCATLVNLLLVFILTSTGATSSLGYIIAFAVIIVVLLYYYFTKIFERILPMFNYVPAVVGIVCIGFVGLLSALAITPWWLNLILVVLIIAGYFAYNYFGIAQLEEQMESEKKKSLSIYDYVDLKTNKKQWKSTNSGNADQKITYNVGGTKNKTYFNKADSKNEDNKLKDFIDSLEKKDK